MVGPLKVSHRQEWTDLLAAGLAREKLDGQCLEVLMGLQEQLHLDQRYRPLSPKQVRVRAVADQELTPYGLTDLLPN